MLKKILIVMLCLVASISTQAVLANNHVMISDAWIADAPPVAKIRAGYLKLHNMGTHTISIKDFSSPAFARIELHKTVIEDGMVKMQEVKQLSVKPGEQIEFKPGGYHLMLFTPRQKLQQGDKINLTIRLKDGMTSSFTATVQKRGDSMQHDHEHHHH